MLIANATGCSSIYGGNLPTSPYTTDTQGRGPARTNSLFEDNAEFGLGFRLSTQQHRQRALRLLNALAGQLPTTTVTALQQEETSSEIRRQQIAALRAALTTLSDPQARALAQTADAPVDKSIWLIGGDGWAYDIGFGGLDHVLSLSENVNVLVPIPSATPIPADSSPRRRRWRRSPSLANSVNARRVRISASA